MHPGPLTLTEMANMAVFMASGKTSRMTENHRQPDRGKPGQLAANRPRLFPERSLVCVRQATRRPVQVGDGKIQISDGPFAETKEQIGCTPAAEKEPANGWLCRISQ